MYGGFDGGVDSEQDGGSGGDDSGIDSSSNERYSGPYSVEYDIRDSYFDYSNSSDVAYSIIEPETEVELEDAIGYLSYEEQQRQEAQSQTGADSSGCLTAVLVVCLAVLMMVCIL